MCRPGGSWLVGVIVLICTSAAVSGQPNQAAQQHYEAGLQHKKDGNTVQALQELTAAVTQCSTYADAYWARGWVQADLGHKDGACFSFNRFLGLSPDDPRAQQAREAIGRLGGDVSPNTDGPATEPTLELELTAEQAQKLVLEAEQAFYGGNYAIAVDKAEKAAGAFPDKERLYYTLALAYGGLERWGEAFETTEKLLAVADDRQDMECFQIAAALAPDYPALAAGFSNEMQMSLLIGQGDLSRENSDEWMQQAKAQAVGDDPQKQFAYSIGKALYSYLLFFDWVNDTQSMQLAHEQLVTALENPECPAALQPGLNQWVSHLTTLDFLWPQSEIELKAYGNETKWGQMLLAQEIDYDQVKSRRMALSLDYASEDETHLQYTIGRVMATHDLSWRYSGDGADEVAERQLRMAAELMRETARQATLPPRAQRLLDFLNNVSPDETLTVAQRPQRPERTQRSPAAEAPRHTIGPSRRVAQTPQIGRLNQISTERLHQYLRLFTAQRRAIEIQLDSLPLFTPTVQRMQLLDQARALLNQEVAIAVELRNRAAAQVRGGYR